MPTIIENNSDVLLLRIFPSLILWKQHHSREKEGQACMIVLAMLAVVAASDNGMRFVLLALLFVAVVLLLIGATIAVITWRGLRKQQKQSEKELT